MNTSSSNDVPKNKRLSPLEKKLVDQFARQGFVNQSLAFRNLRPQTKASSSQAQASRILNRPHVREYLDSLNAPSSQEVLSTKKKFIAKVNRITDKAEGAEQYGAALKGCELEAKVEGLFSQEEGDTAQYMQFFDKVSIVVNNPVKGGPAEMKVIEGTVEHG